MPVIGVVSIVVNDKMRRESRKQLTRLALTASVLLGIYVVVVVSALMLTKPPVV
jgi:hypothetical protein